MDGTIKMGIPNRKKREIMSEKIQLSEEQAEQLFAEIDNEGLGYWTQHYGYKGEEDPKLKELCEKAKKAMNELDAHIQAIFGEYEIG
jgi:di/tripeptidase